MGQYKSFSQAHALIIAIAEYEGNNALPATVTKDARDVANALTAAKYCGYENSNVRMLLNSEATLSNILSEMSELARDSDENDTVFIYFSGHGCNQGDNLNPNCFLVPVDFNSPDGGLLSEGELSSLLSVIRSERLLIVIDACHSAGVAGFKSFSQNRTEVPGFTDKSLARLAQGRGKVLIASSRDSETSLILPGDQNSLFTKHFLSALKGAAGSADDDLIRVFDIFSYLEEGVPVDAKNAGEEQHPVFKSTLENNFPVALRCGGVKKLATTVGTVASINRDRILEDVLAELYPGGPSDQGIWLRAGGDISRLKLDGTGRSQWFAALRLLQQGGGGADISLDSLLLEVKSEFPNHSGIT
jgi:hypothetical protein